MKASVCENISNKHLSSLANVRYAFRCLFVTFVVAYSFSQLFWGLDLTDSFYYLSLFKSGTIHLSILGFQLFGRCWISLFGETILSLRIANWLFYVLAFVLAYIWFIPHGERKKCLSFLSLPFLLLPTFSLNILNGDSCTLLIVVCLCKVLVEWISKPDWRLGTVLFFLLYLGSLFRLPNIVASILGFIPVLLFANKKHSWVRYLSICCVSIAMYVLTCLLVALSGKFSGIDESHILTNLILNYWKDAKTVLSFLPLCVFVILICFESHLKQPWRVLLSTVVLLYFAYWLKCEVKLGFVCHNLSLFVSAFFSAICLLSIYKSLAYGKSCLLLIIVLLMSFVNPAGADTGLLKMVWMPIAFLPAVLVYMKSYVKKPVLFGLIMAFLTAFSLLGHYENPFGEPPLSQLTYFIDNEKVSNIRTDSAQFGLYESVRNDVDSLGIDNVVLYGELSWGLNELLGIKQKVETTFFMDADNDSDIKAIKDCINQGCFSVVFMPYKPNGAKTIFENRTELTRMEKMLMAEDYILTKRTDYYYIYSPKATQLNTTDDRDRI